MNEFDPKKMLTAAFMQVRKRGLKLGIGELLDALRAVGGGFGVDEKELREIAGLLWCGSNEEKSELDEAWNDAISDLRSDEPIQTDSQLKTDRKEKEPESFSQPLGAIAEKRAAKQPPSHELKILPVQVRFSPAFLESKSDFEADGPISRRSMSYIIRHFRRPIPDGPPRALDIKATVEQAARQGFYLAPAYKREERNHAHLLLFVDQGGSMTPFRHFTRDLVETALFDSEIGKNGQVDVFYFHNAISTSVYLDPHMTMPIALEQATAQCTADSGILIVGDAGAARGYFRLERIRNTAEFLYDLKRYTALMAWLNPMPQERWAGSSSQIIAGFVPMFHMNHDGFSNAIDVVRGQPHRHEQ